MSDEIPAPVPPIDVETIMARWAAHAQRAAELHPANKASLFAALAAAGITRVTVRFDGSGDSGQIEDISAVADNTKVELPTVEIELVNHVWGQEEPRRTLMPVAEAIEQLAYDLLSLTHCGWENNDGAYGEFVFDVAKQSISLEHNERYVTAELYSHSW